MLLCILPLVKHSTMCYNIITVKEGNKPKTKKQNPLPDTSKFTANTKKRKSKMKRVDNRTTKNLVDFCKVMRQLVIEIDL